MDLYFSIRNSDLYKYIMAASGQISENLLSRLVCLSISDNTVHRAYVMSGNTVLC